MDGGISLVLLAIAVAVFVLASPFLAWMAFFRVRRLEEELAALRSSLALAGATRAGAAAPSERAQARATEAPTPAAGSEPASGPQAAPDGSAGPSPEPTFEPSSPSPSGLEDGRERIEQNLAERWLVWLGAVALGLGGLFLAGWAIEQGLLGPRARVGLAWLTGIVLVVLAELAHRRAPAGRGLYLVPAALAVGGLCALYGATVAASQLYGLISPLLALALLASTAVSALALAYRFGSVLALLGALGAFAAPFLVRAEEPELWPLVVYLASTVATLLVVARLSLWSWLAWATASGATLWALVFSLGLLAPASLATAPVAAYLLTAGLCALAFAASLPENERIGRFHAGRAAGTLLSVAALGLVLWIRLGEEAPSVVAAMTLLTLATAAAAWRRPAEHWTLGLAAAAGLLAAATWAIPPLLSVTSQLHDPSVALEPVFWLVPEARPLAIALAVVALFHGVLGLLGSFRRPRPGFWAGLGASVPVLALAAAWWRLGDFAVSPPLAGLALVLAVLFVLLAERTARRRGLEAATAAWAVGASAGLALALAIALETSWLTVALALEIAAIAWVAQRSGLAALRRPALVLLAVVLARLVLATDLDAPPAPLATTLYAYGLPLLALLFAARLFARVPAPPVAGLEGMLATAAVLLWVLLLTELLRLASGTERFDELAGLPMLTGSMLVWLLTGLALLRLGERDSVPTAAALAGLVLVAGGLLQLLGLVFGSNPAVTGEPVGPWPVLNLLLPAYLVPAAVLAWAARGLGLGRLPGLRLLFGARRPARVPGFASLALIFLWLSLEVRRWFHAPGVAGPRTDAEYLALSLAWLGLAAALLVAGIALGSRDLRAAALVVGGAAILKAFLFDLADLEGLYRAASFLALGLCLIAVGWLYRRFVAEPTTKAS
ncbi:MAG: DUF2339 domain-containing protein [Geminicoccaceae bacterium]|nr:DUF2339 domain-containing protein [Geminicoccaceae bacterium]